MQTDSTYPVYTGDPEIPPDNPPEAPPPDVPPGVPPQGPPETPAEPPPEIPPGQPRNAKVGDLIQLLTKINAACKAPGSKCTNFLVAP